MNSSENYIIFDSGFLRRLVTASTHPEINQWQKFFADELNRRTPFTPALGPLCLFEFLNQKIARPEFPPLRLPEPSTKGSEKNRRAVNDTAEKWAEIAFDFAKNTRGLTAGNLIKLMNIQSNLHTRSDGKKLLEACFKRYRQAKEFPYELHLALGFDHIQRYLQMARPGHLKDVMALQVFKDMLAGYGDGYNFSFIRIITVIYLEWHRIHGLKTLGTQRPLLSLKSEGDMGDTETLHFALFGLHTEEGHHPVTVFTYDKRDDVVNRLRFAKYAVDLFSRHIIQPEEFNYKLPPLKSGVVVVCHPHECRVIGEIDVSSLDTSIESPKLRRSPTDDMQNEEDIRLAAYYNWLNRGCPVRDDWYDWFAVSDRLGM